ncbi:MAG: hypothetical protein N2745_09230 [Syntrophorhabdaceae bacterium]|nr:hypothetical protein [Syntrophorhabdaceae bacterium]
MTISDYQVSSVIKTYMKHMKVRIKSSENREEKSIPFPEDRVIISDEAIKKMLYNRIGEQMAEKLKNHE